MNWKCPWNFADYECQVEPEKEWSERKLKSATEEAAQ